MSATITFNKGGKKGGAFNLHEGELKRSRTLIWTLALFILSFIVWASIFELDEVSAGSGKVVASSRTQDIQSLDGGILEVLYVREGDIVEAGQPLAKMDPTRVLASLEESASKLRANQAMAARLTAEVNDSALTFPEEIKTDKELVKSETELYKSRRNALEKALAGIREAQRLAAKELQLTRTARSGGAASEVDVIRLESRVNELKMRENQERNDYYVKAREELARVNAAIESQRQISVTREDVLKRTTLASPVRGVVKEIAITTVGGVLPPNGKLMTLIPLDDKLEIETKISPKDIAYIRPGQQAKVKITAYDYSIYGGLEGEVVQISPDTIQDDVRRDQYYYRVYIRTEKDMLIGKDGREMPIVPGMMATVDIHTGSKTILQYIIKPMNKAREALRER